MHVGTESKLKKVAIIPPRKVYGCALMILEKI